ncbi:hypothetical protein D3C77_413080 [compost metagenome]
MHGLNLCQGHGDSLFIKSTLCGALCGTFACATGGSQGFGLFAAYSGPTSPVRYQRSIQHGQWRHRARFDALSVACLAQIDDSVYFTAKVDIPLDCGLLDCTLCSLKEAVLDRQSIACNKGYHGANGAGMRRQCPSFAGVHSGTCAAFEHGYDRFVVAGTDLKARQQTGCFATSNVARGHS